MILKPAEPVKVLIVDDDEDDYLIARDMLESQGRASLSVEWCPDYDGSLALIAAERHDVYLIDYRLGEHTGLELVRAAFTDRQSAPVIILTGQSDYEIDLEATELGVTDFLLKQELSASSLERTIRYALRHQAAVRELARSEERYELAARAVNDGIWDWDLRTGQVHFSSRWHALLGRTGPETSNGPEAWFELVDSHDLANLRTMIDAHLSGQSEHLESEDRMFHLDGSTRWMLTRGLAVRDGNGMATRMAGSLSDVTERRTAEDRLRRDAFYDSLTGLPNRALFLDRLGQAIRQRNRYSTLRHAILFLDLDRFKAVNDTFSHAVGDSLLISVASRLSSTVRPGDTVARIGGDEFTVLLGATPETDPQTAATHVAERIHKALASGFEIAGRRVFVTASIGIALSDRDADAAEVVRNADIAMYEAKRRCSGRSAVFDLSMHRRIADRLSQESDLRRAVEEGLLRVYYQPVIDIRSGEIGGFEALARWPEGWEAVAPLEFILIAEETGLIRLLGLHVLRRALLDLKSWRRAGLVADHVRMSVNVSCRQLDDPRFSEDTLEAMDVAGLPGGALRLEITEGTLMREPERVSTIVAEVCGTGVGLELDDFGTGYSSLVALQRFPFKALKIDRSFVATLAEDTNSEAIIRSTIMLAHSLGLGVIAEGIESAVQLRQLRALGCEYGQGYLFARPLSQDHVETFIRSYSPAATLNDAEAS